MQSSCKIAAARIANKDRSLCFFCYRKLAADSRLVQIGSSLPLTILPQTCVKFPSVKALSKGKLLRLTGLTARRHCYHHGRIELAATSTYLSWRSSEVANQPIYVDSDKLRINEVNMCNFVRYYSRDIQTTLMVRKEYEIEQPA